MPKPVASVGVLRDTGFLIRLNQPSDPLHANARTYLKFCLEKQFPMFVSTIALAEYAVRDRIANLPMRYFRVVPFNIDHAQRASDFASTAFGRRQLVPEEFVIKVTGRRVRRVPSPTPSRAQDPSLISLSTCHRSSADACGDTKTDALKAKAAQILIDAEQRSIKTTRSIRRICDL